MIRNIIWLKKRKGLDKPIFLVVTIALALMFVALYFAAVSGWLDVSVEQFGTIVNEKKQVVQ